MNTTRIFSRIALGAVVAAAMATPAWAAIYRVNFAGKVVEVDCPESPAGHSLTWVNQNCTAVMVSPGGTGVSPLDAAPSGAQPAGSSRPVERDAPARGPNNTRN